MVEDYDSSSDNSDSDGDQEGHNGDEPMMSIFASYYGIESTGDTNAAESDKEKPTDNIDDGFFDSGTYVKTLLATESISNLVAKDTKLVHEIRTLDGEMQKLVYDNYNKFITATETIKEMKNDVHGMDGDMAAIQVKMSAISQSSEELDGKFEVKRTQIDKLVRVRRLLNRLEFLSELPEKLAFLIDKKMFKVAVELYNNTISVLTRHSHVLSFKKIKERIEGMMTDLTGKVINLMDDPSLEAVKLTQYVTVLRLMNAPRSKVMKKLLSTHRRRSGILISQFTDYIQDAFSSLSKSPSSSFDLANPVNKAREFHQVLVVGLIEACKGIGELYQPVTTGGRHESRLEEFEEAYGQLSEMTYSVMSDYTKTLLAAFEAFFRQYGALFYAALTVPSSASASTEALDAMESFAVDTVGEGASDHDADSEDGVDNGDNDDNDNFNNNEDDNENMERNGDSSDDDEHDLGEGASARRRMNKKSPSEERRDEENKLQAEKSTAQRARQFRLAELSEERNAWLLLGRNAVMDVIFLDNAQRECLESVVGKGATRDTPSLLDQSKTGSNGPSPFFSERLVEVLQGHCDALLHVRIDFIVQSVWSDCLPTLLQYCCSQHSSGGFVSMSCDNKSGGSFDMFKARVTAVKAMYDTLIEEVNQVFSDSCKDLRPVVDIFEICSLDADPIVESLVSKFFFYLADKIEARCMVMNHHCTYNAGTNSMTYRYGSRAPRRLTAKVAGDLGEIDDEIYSELPAPREWEDESGLMEGVSAAPPAIEGSTVPHKAHLLFFSSFANRLIPLLIDNIYNSLDAIDFPKIDVQPESINRLELTALLLSKDFIEENAVDLANRFTKGQYVLYTDCCSTNEPLLDEVTSSTTMVLNISDSTLDVGMRLDALAVTTCMLLSAKLPSQTKSSENQFGSAMNRRGSMSTSMATKGNALQRDIERLFVDRVPVSSPFVANPNCEFVVNNVVKAVIKSAQESIRFMTLSRTVYLQQQANITFLKQLSPYLLRDISDSDILVDQTLTTVFARYSGANDIANASDSKELTMISRAIAKAFAAMTEQGAVVISTA